jgi:hypothetical protein
MAGRPCDGRRANLRPPLLDRTVPVAFPHLTRPGVRKPVGFWHSRASRKRVSKNAGKALTVITTAAGRLGTLASAAQQENMMTDTSTLEPAEYLRRLFDDF